MREPVELLCSHCGERFRIGVDSHLVTDEDVLEIAKAYGARAVIYVGTPTRKPDLAQHCTLDEDSKVANLRKLDAIFMDLAEGKQRAWYCEACKSTNDYPQEWHRGPKKETPLSIPSPKCDVCAKDVGRSTGYILSTSEVTRESNYWRFAFLNNPTHIQAIGADGRRLISFVIERSGDPGAWLVCEECISMFSVDKVKARQLCQEQWTEKDSVASRQLGPADWKKSLVAASEGWKTAFGSEPKPDRNDVDISLALTIYRASTAKWK